VSSWLLLDGLLRGMGLHVASPPDVSKALQRATQSLPAR
jgi:hypothetical protein